MNSTRSKLFALLCSTTLCASMSAQVDWTLLTPTASPLARTKASLDYDYANGRLLMFGGIGAGGTTLSETWVFDGATWTQLSPSTVPPGRWQHATASDIVRARIVMFSGWSGGFYHPDTWEWDGQDWTQLQPTTSPPPRDHHAMTFDVGRGRTVLFGGWSWTAGSVLYNDTWEWDGQNWTQITTAAAPSGRDGHAICYDFARGNTVLFGGGREAATRLGDTWTYDGTNWVQANPANSPQPRANHRMAYDFDREVVVLFGGYDGPSSGGGTYYGDVWEWDGQDWRQRTTPTSPTPRAYASVAFDQISRTIVSAGGDNAGGGAGSFGETWRYGPLFPASNGTFGNGCAGTVGVPALESGNPWLNEPVTLTLSGLPVGTPAFFVIGFSNTMSAGGPLPISLANIGMPGCFLLVDNVIAVSAPNPAGHAELGVPVPNDPNLLGQNLYTQGIVGDPGANPFGLIVSNGASGTFGGK